MVVPETPGQRTSATAYVVAGAGVATLLAFFAMPLASLPILGSLTGANAAALASRIGSLGLLWLVPLAAVVIVGVGAWQGMPARRSVPGRRAGMLAALGASVVGLLVHLVVLLAVQGRLAHAGASRWGINVLSLVGAGFWIGLLALLTAATAAFLDVRRQQANRA